MLHISRRPDTQHNDIQNNDTQHKWHTAYQHNVSIAITHNVKLYLFFMLCVVMLSVIMLNVILLTVMAHNFNHLFLKKFSSIDLKALS